MQPGLMLFSGRTKSLFSTSESIKSDMYERIMKGGLPQIRCQLHDHAKQYDNDGACHNKRNGGKLRGNISRNGYGNAMIGRYGGCF